jgi:hypothetical protein
MVSLCFYMVSLSDRLLCSTSFIMFTVCIMRSVMASLLSLTADGRPFYLAAMFWRVSLFSLKKRSMLSLSLMILSVMISRRSSLDCYPPLLSVFALLADSGLPPRALYVPLASFYCD